MASLIQWTRVWASSVICLKDREAWGAAVHGVTNCWTWLSNWTTTYIKEITNKDLLNSTGNYIQYLIIMYNGKESKKWLDPTAILLTETFSYPGFVLLCQHICILNFQAKSLGGILIPSSFHSYSNSLSCSFFFQICSDSESKLNHFAETNNTPL